MRLTPSHVWALTLGASALLWVLAPSWRLLTTLLLAAHAGILAWGIASLRSGFFGHAVTGPRPGTRRIALTFDDGPDEAVTPRVLDLLAQYHCRATFFVVASKARRAPSLVQRAIHEGHSVACHDLNHSPLANLRVNPWMRDQIRQARDMIATVTGHLPSLYRPPVGLSNPHLFPALRALGMTCVGWSHSARDAGNRRLSAIAHIPDLAVDGAVVLLHDSAPDARRAEAFLDALRRLLDAAKGRELSAVPVEELLGLEPYSQRPARC